MLKLINLQFHGGFEISLQDTDIRQMNFFTFAFWSGWCSLVCLHTSTNRHIWRTSFWFMQKMIQNCTADIYNTMVAGQKPVMPTWHLLEKSLWWLSSTFFAISVWWLSCHNAIFINAVCSLELFSLIVGLSKTSCPVQSLKLRFFWKILLFPLDFPDFFLGGIAKNPEIRGPEFSQGWTKSKWTRGSIADAPECSNLCADATLQPSGWADLADDVWNGKMPSSKQIKRSIWRMKNGKRYTDDSIRSICLSIHWSRFLKDSITGKRPIYELLTSLRASSSSSTSSSMPLAVVAVVAVATRAIATARSE